MAGVCNRRENIYFLTDINRFCVAAEINAENIFQHLQFLCGGLTQNKNYILTVENILYGDRSIFLC